MAVAARPREFVEVHVRILDVDGELVCSCCNMWPVGTFIEVPFQQALDWLGCDWPWVEGEQFLLVEVLDFHGQRQTLDPQSAVTVGCTITGRAVRP